MCPDGHTDAKEIKMNKEFLDKQSREQLYIFIMNDEYVISNLRKYLKKLTGCGNFGNVDGMDGSCIECSNNNKDLFCKCWNFKFDKK